MVIYDPQNHKGLSEIENICLPNMVCTPFPLILIRYDIKESIQKRKLIKTLENKKNYLFCLQLN